MTQPQPKPGNTEIEEAKSTMKKALDALNVSNMALPNSKKTLLDKLHNHITREFSYYLDAVESYCQALSNYENNRFFRDMSDDDKAKCFAKKKLSPAMEAKKLEYNAVWNTWQREKRRMQYQADVFKTSCVDKIESLRELLKDIPRERSFFSFLFNTSTESGENPSQEVLRTLESQILLTIKKIHYIDLAEYPSTALENNFNP